MSTLGEQLAVLEETVLHLRVEHAQLVGRLAELSDTMAANIEDRDRVIGAKTQVIEDLEAQKAGIVKEREDLREGHAKAMAAVEDGERAADLEAKRQTDEILSQLELLTAYQAMKVEVTRKLGEAHANFDAASARRAADMEALEERVKADELHWVAEMTRSAEAGAKAQREMIAKVSHTYATLQREHGDMRAVVADQARELDALLAENAARARTRDARLLEYASLAEMNDLSRAKLRDMGSLSGAGFVNFDASTIVTRDSASLVESKAPRPPPGAAGGSPRRGGHLAHDDEGSRPRRPRGASFEDDEPAEDAAPPSAEPPPDFEMLAYLCVEIKSSTRLQCERMRQC